MSCNISMKLVVGIEIQHDELYKNIFCIAKERNDAVDFTSLSIYNSYVS